MYVLKVAHDDRWKTVHLSAENGEKTVNIIVINLTNVHDMQSTCVPIDADGIIILEFVVSLIAAFVEKPPPNHRRSLEYAKNKNPIAN